MLWRAHFFRTLQSTVSLKKDPSCDKFTVNKRKFHFQPSQLKRFDTRKTLNVEKRRFISTESAGFNYITKALAKFSPDNISKLTGLPTIEELTKNLNLAHCLPVEAFQDSFLYLHTSLGLPWWSVIAISALSTRLLLLPLVIFAERKNAQVNNNIPRVRLLEKQLGEANKAGDIAKSSRLIREISLFKSHRQITWGLLNTSIVTLVQAPIFVLFLTAIRGLPNTQLQSMRQGGLYWFTDLTVNDPKFLLPIFTTLTLSIILELSLLNAKYMTENKFLIYTLRAHPFIIMPFIANFSSAFLLYWICYNFITIFEASIFRIPAVRNYFKIEKIFSLLPNAFSAKNPVLIKRSCNISKKFDEELERKQRLQTMRYSKVKKGHSGKQSSGREIANMRQIPQRLKLKAIMESARPKF